MTEDTEVPNISEKASRHTVTSLKVSTVKKTASTAKAGSLTTMISATCVLPLSVLPLMRTVILSSKRAELMNSLRGRTPEYQPRPRIIIPSANFDTAVYMTLPFPDSSCIRVLHSHL